MRRRDLLRSSAGLLTAGLVAGRGTAATTNFAPSGELSIRGAKEAVVSEDGSTAFVAATNGYAVADLSTPSDPTLLAERRDLLPDRENGPMSRLFDAKLDGDVLAVVGPANPVRTGSPRGALLIDVSDPSDPQRLSFYETPYVIHNCAFADGYLYLTGNGATADTNPLVVVDATDPTAPEEVARWRLTDHDDRWSSVSSGLRQVHDVWIRDELAVLAHWDAGSYLLDVSDPTEPSYLGNIEGLAPEDAEGSPRRQSSTPPGNYHYAVTNADNTLLAVGKETWALNSRDGYVGGPSGIELHDISDPTQPSLYSEIQPPSSSDPTIQGIWTTSHNFDLRDGTLYTSWYHGGIKRHDVSDPANPTEQSWWVDPETARFWTAKVLTPGETVLASDIGTRDSRAGLRVFPDTDGVGGRPEALTDESTPTVTASPTPTPTPTDPTPTADSTPTTEPASTTEPAPTTDDTTVADAPGFGVAAGLAGVGALAWRLRQTDDD